MDIVRSIALHFTIFSVKAELDQIIQGLHEGGMFWDDEETKQLVHLFCENKESDKASTLTAVQFQRLFPPILSPSGSNRRDLEEEMLLHWSYFLADVQDGKVTIANPGAELLFLTIEDILVFATGATSIPLLGFDTEGSVRFLHDGGKFPTSSTCSMTIRLPIVMDYEVFKERMAFAILNAHGFLELYDHLHVMVFTELCTETMSIVVVLKVIAFNLL